MPRCRIRWRPAPSRCSSWGRWPAGERLAMRVSRVALAGGLSLALLIVVGCIPGQFAGFLPTSAAELGDITLPPGFRIELYAADVPNARQMAAGPAGVVFVGSRSEGKVYAVVDRGGAQRQVHVLASGLNMPSGDRKSTRLNSSHTVISYAVFCLKKK